MLSSTFVHLPMMLYHAFLIGPCNLVACFSFITGRNEVVAKVMFLLVSVILSGGGVPQCMLGYHPPGTHPPGADTPPPAPGSRLQHTVNERPVRILLECILVIIPFVSFCRKKLADLPKICCRSSTHID